MGKLRSSSVHLSLVLASTLLAGCDSTVKEDPTPVDFVGTWTGKWDGKWAVQFSISQDPKTGELQAVYEWEGQAGEGLMLKEVLPAVIEDDALRVGKTIRIVIDASNPDRAEAVGDFPRPRRARLHRQ